MVGGGVSKGAECGGGEEVGVLKNLSPHDGHIYLTRGR